MERMSKKQGSLLRCSTTAALGMHKDSQMIFKEKPKVRIIHIFAPEVIKTDVANFRELVQRLTGKPTDKAQQRRSEVEPRANNVQKMEQRVKEEESNHFSVDNSSGEFLSAFADLQGFIEELGEFPLLPLEPPHMHGF